MFDWRLPLLSRLPACWAKLCFLWTKWSRPQLEYIGPYYINLRYFRQWCPLGFLLEQWVLILLDKPVSISLRSCMHVEASNSSLITLSILLLIFTAFSMTYEICPFLKFPSYTFLCLLQPLKVRNVVGFSLFWDVLYTLDEVDILFRIQLGGRCCVDFVFFQFCLCLLCLVDSMPLFWCLRSSLACFSACSCFESLMDGFAK